MATAENYRQTHIMTASPMELVLMLYDECIKALKESEAAFKLDGPDGLEKISNGMLRAQDAITELMVSLDMEKGGEVADNLHRLYDFMISHLSKANLEKSVEPVVEVRTLMADLREAWQELADKAVEASPEQASPPPTMNNVLAAG